MAKSKQRTIKKEISINGVGLHTGCDVNITLKPAKVDSGIQFQRTDLDIQPVIKASVENVCIDSNLPRCTTIGTKDCMIHTVEHLMSALAGLGITNIHIDIDASELPGCDGSAKEFVEAIRSVGIEEQEENVEPYKVMEAIGVSDEGASIFIAPSEELIISYVLDYEHPMLRSQYLEVTVTEDLYEKQIANCRTFCLESEANELQSKGLGKGANYKNTLVVGDKDVIENEVRFKDEFVRHKILDIIGDLYLLGAPLKGHIFAFKSGHELNAKLLRKICEQKKVQKIKTERAEFDFEGKKEIDIQGIMKVLPHRYPFLLVDRVIEIEHGKKAVGIKNVTINDGFFQGHFPTRPVMPGVLMVEAMAQTGGVVVLTNPSHRGKLAFFMAVDNVKFRKVVTAGDQLLMEVEVVKDRSRVTQVHSKARVNGEIVAEADMTFSFTDASYLD